ncbi:MAG: polyphosphate polymerase domain-containing protein [Erysipelotrichaceae bacterium]|nr:polyphosphate polymerase domain-containing protein [Erysipelotrichaceae bacterium]MBR5049449.1 polyphosphate polymerase domain-containing protein [Erysipelotrichaceae bacterium]
MEYQQIFERVEAKYVLTDGQYDQLMKLIGPHLSPDLYPHSEIRSIYFDSGDFRLVRNSLDKPAYKEKLRLRSYGEVSDDSPVFLEIKKKCRGICYKRRQDMTYRQALNYTVFDRKPMDSQIMNEIDYLRTSCQLQPKVLICYQRDSFVSADQPDLRITFDRDVRFSLSNIALTNSNPEGTVLDSGSRIMEVKTLTAMPLWLTGVLDSLNVYPSSFSKYGAVYEKYLMKGVSRKCSKYYSHRSSPVHLPLQTTCSAR